MEPSPPTHHGTLVIRLAMAAAFLSAWVMGMWHHDFPYVYHPDEPAKVAQVLSGRRDFHHPPLMLTLTRGWLDLTHSAATPQEVVRAGRAFSALALAGTAAALTWLAGTYGGPAGAVCAAAALGTDAQAILAGHFFKEDALFALGFALTMCAGAWHWRRRNVQTCLALGAAAGMALGVKYVGMLAVVYATNLAWMAATASVGDESGGRWWRRAAAGGLCLLSAAAMFGLLDGPAIVGHLDEWWRGLRQGVEVSEHGNKAVGARVPHLAFVGMFFLFTPLPVMAGAAAYWWNLRRVEWRQHADRWFLGLLPLGLIAVFSFSASTAVRYFLPVSLALDCVAGVAWAGIVRAVSGWWERRRAHPLPVSLPACVAVGLILAWTLPVAWTLLEGFGRDDRADLRRWIAAHVPPSAVIAEDALAQLENSAANGVPGLPQRLMSRPCVADFGDIAVQRANGVSYVAVCWYDSRRYLDPSKHPAASAVSIYERRRAFYRSLPNEARRLWQSDLRQPYALRPGLELYQISGN